MLIEEAINILGEYAGETIIAEEFGLNISSIQRQQIWGIDWGSIHPTDMPIDRLLLWHGDINKEKALYRLRNMETASPLHVLCVQSGEMVVHDGTHRMFCMKIAGFAIAKCRVFRLP